MTVLTPFPGRAANTDTLDRGNVSVLRTEINRIMNNALGSAGDLPSQVPTARNPILTLQAEINRIVSLLLQTLPASGPVAPGTGFTPVPQTLPSYPPVAGAIPFGATVSGAGINNFGATLLAEINRVFSSVLQDTDMGVPSTGFAPIPGLHGGSGLPQSTVQFLQNEINRVFSTVLQDPAGAGDPSLAFTPRVNLVETTDTIEIEAELPGFTESDIDLAVMGNVVTIKGWRRRNASEDLREFHILERGYGTFSRSLTLPFEADPSLIRASFGAGVLMIEITKPDMVRENTSRIEIAKAG